MNTISPQSMVHNAASMLGPALAGVAVGLIGYAGNFFLNATSFLGVLIALYIMRIPASGARPRNNFAATALQVHSPKPVANTIQKPEANS